jgi:hypothetical protein
MYPAAIDSICGWTLASPGRVQIADLLARSSCYRNPQANPNKKIKSSICWDSDFFKNLSRISLFYPFMFFLMAEHMATISFDQRRWEIHLSQQR